MKRFLTPLPIGIVLADLIYGFVLNVMQGLNLQQTASNQSGTISVTPDIAFNSLQIVANGGMVCIIGFGLIVLFQLNRAVLRQQILPIGIFRTLGLLAVLAFSISSLWEWLHAALSLLSGHNVLNFSNPRYLVTAACMPISPYICELPPLPDAQAAKLSVKTAAVKIFNIEFPLSTKIISGRNGNGKRRFQIRF